MQENSAGLNIAAFCWIKLQRSVVMQRYKVIGSFTREQFREYVSAIPINEGHRQIRPVKFGRPMGVSLSDVIDRIRRK